MNKISQTIYGVLGIAMIVAFFYYMYKLIAIVADNINKVDPNIVVASIAGAVTITGYFISRYLEKTKAIELQVREQKLPVYEEFIGFFLFILQDKEYLQLEDDEKNKKLLEFMLTFTKKSLLWVSDETLLAVVKWRNEAVNPSTQDPIAALRNLENLLFAFRKDVGHTNKNIKKGDLLSMFINDIDLYREQLN